MRKNYYHDLRSIIRFDRFNRPCAFLLVTVLLLVFVLFHLALTTLKGEKNTVKPIPPHESLRKAVVRVTSHAEQNHEHPSGLVNLSDENPRLLSSPR
ncbi:hypothetical protein P879_10998 [Paragonimus westermani]|uniref:Uncharacterized protein n=1 Tax=Paragonimus westermani TaxID=34504 RepID=A0A8T0DDD4_9TREM|nr:hypothetical protein P879_10998 [Paragonimus westermani]